MNDEYFQNVKTLNKATVSGLLVDRDIIVLSTTSNKLPLIENFIGESVRHDAFGNPIIGYGLDSSGYDCRLGSKLKIFDNIKLLAQDTGIIDPLKFSESSYTEVSSNDYFIIPPNSYALGSTIEYFNVPSNITPVCLGKSSYARSGIIINPTLFKPGWSGNAVIEISNATPCPIKVYANQGIASIIFLSHNEPVEDYQARGGRYTGQTGIQDPK